MFPTTNNNHHSTLNQQQQQHSNDEEDRRSNSTFSTHSTNLSNSSPPFVIPQTKEERGEFSAPTTSASVGLSSLHIDNATHVTTQSVSVDGAAFDKACDGSSRNTTCSVTVRTDNAPFCTDRDSETTTCVISDHHGAVKSPESCHIISGVEHVFFEDEFAKMEGTTTTTTTSGETAQTQKNNVVILAVDGTSHSELAFKFYKENVDRPGYYLHVVHHSDVWTHYNSLEGAVMYYLSIGPSANHCQEIAEKATGAAAKIETKYKKLMEEFNVDGEVVVLHGKDAWHDIIQHQEKCQAMMIVMGTRGGGALSRTFRGSVSDSVVHHANVPVLVCCHPKN